MFFYIRPGPGYSPGTNKIKLFHLFSLFNGLLDNISTIVALITSLKVHYDNVDDDYDGVMVDSVKFIYMVSQLRYFS